MNRIALREPPRVSAFTSSGLRLEDRVLGPAAF
jgi:hypothetical protein